MKDIRSAITRFLRDERGQDIIEYGLLAAFIALVVAAILILIGTELNTLYNNILTKLQAATSAGT